MSMQRASDTSEARDPNAYSDGYDFGLIPRPHMGDEELLARCWSIALKARLIAAAPR